MSNQSSTQRAIEIEPTDQGLTRKILLAMVVALILGCGYYELGSLSSPLLDFFDQYIVNGVLELVGEYFVRALKMVVVPLVFFSLVAGLTTGLDTQAGSSFTESRLGRRAAYTFVLYLGTTMIAVTLALIVAHLIDPGAGISIETQSQFVPPEKRSVVDVLSQIVPSNIVAAFASGNMLAVIFVSISIGVSINQCGQAGQRIAQTCQDINEVVTKLIFIIMSFAPLGVFALVFEVFANQGVYFMSSLARYFLTVVLALILHAAIFYSSIVRVLAGVSPIVFWMKMRQVMVFAFSTASSAATIGINLRNLTQRLGVRRDIGSFTIPLGATINMDGTAIMQGVAVIFIAGVYGYDLTLIQFIEVIALATLASVGTAAVPSAGLVTLSVVLVQVNLPAQAIGLIIGVDRLLDMLRTAINVAGDAAISLAVARREDGIDHDCYNTR